MREKMHGEQNQTPGTRYAVTVRLFAGSLGIMALTGCMRDQMIVVDDPHVLLPSFRVGVRLDDGKQSAAEPQSGHAVELEFTKAKGSDTQSYEVLGTPPPLVFGNTTFTAPQQVTRDFDFDYADISYRWRKFFRERSLGLELSGGVGHTSLGLTLSSPAQRASEHYATDGLQGGAAFIWRMRPKTSLQARVSAFVSTSSTGVHDFERGEIFLAQALGENLSLRAGYAEWIMYGSGRTYPMSFGMAFSGPIVDIGLDF